MLNQKKMEKMLSKKLHLSKKEARKTASGLKAAAYGAAVGITATAIKKAVCGVGKGILYGTCRAICAVENKQWKKATEEVKEKMEEEKRKETRKKEKQIPETKSSVKEEVEEDKKTEDFEEETDDPVVDEEEEKESEVGSTVLLNDGSEVEVLESETEEVTSESGNIYYIEFLKVRDITDSMNEVFTKFSSLLDWVAERREDPRFADPEWQDVSSVVMIGAADKLWVSNENVEVKHLHDLEEYNATAKAKADMPIVTLHLNEAAVFRFEDANDSYKVVVVYPTVDQRNGNRLIVDRNTDEFFISKSRWSALEKVLIDHGYCESALSSL